MTQLKKLIGFYKFCSIIIQILMQTISPKIFNTAFISRKKNCVVHMKSARYLPYTTSAHN